MRVSRLETRYPALLHLLIVGAAWATYLADRDDIVWRIIRNSSSRRVLEHTIFSFATLLVGAGALLCTLARASRTHRSWTPARLLGEWLYAVGIATLLPLWGSVLLMLGESIRIARLAVSGAELSQTNEDDARWSAAIRSESVKWGIFVTMILFSACLVDRLAEYGILASLLAWALLTLPSCLKRIATSNAHNS